MRGSSSGYKDDEDTPVCSTQSRKQRQRNKHISKYKSKEPTEKERRYSPPARADILLSRSITACSRRRCPLLASKRAFSTFFALANADLVAFSALVLAAVAASQAFLEALSLASREEMRALAASKASVVQTKGE
jgi:hypothetical protein